MESGKRPENYTGSSSFGVEENAGAKVLPEPTERSKGLQVPKTAHSKDDSSNSTGGPSHGRNLLAILLALYVMVTDLQEVMRRLPASRITSSNGKIYISVEFPGKILAIENGNLLVDGVPLGKLLENPPPADKKSTGGK